MYICIFDAVVWKKSIRRNEVGEFRVSKVVKKKIVDLEEILFEWEESCGEEEVSMGCPEMILRVKIINAPR